MGLCDPVPISNDLKGNTSWNWKSCTTQTQASDHKVTMFWTITGCKFDGQWLPTYVLDLFLKYLRAGTGEAAKLPRVQSTVLYETEGDTVICTPTTWVAEA